MSLPNNFSDRLALHEEGTDSLDQAELSWYQSMVRGLHATGELDLKRQLDDYYSEFQEKNSTKVIRLWSAVGIAAILLIGGFYLSTISQSGDPIQLQTNEAPVFSDSATYDSSQNNFENKSNNDVGK